MSSLAACKFLFSNKTLSGSTSAHGVVRHGLSVLRICALTSMKWGASDQKYITRSFQNLKVTVLSFGTILPLKKTWFAVVLVTGRTLYWRRWSLIGGRAGPPLLSKLLYNGGIEKKHTTTLMLVLCSTTAQFCEEEYLLDRSNNHNDRVSNLRLFWELRGSRGAVIR